MMFMYLSIAVHERLLSRLNYHNNIRDVKVTRIDAVLACWRGFVDEKPLYTTAIKIELHYG